MSFFLQHVDSAQLQALGPPILMALRLTFSLLLQVPLRAVSQPEIFDVPLGRTRTEKEIMSRSLRSSGTSSSPSLSLATTINLPDSLMATFGSPNTHGSAKETVQTFTSRSSLRVLSAYDSVVRVSVSVIDFNASYNASSAVAPLGLAQAAAFQSRVSQTLVAAGPEVLLQTFLSQALLLAPVAAQSLSEIVLLSSFEASASPTHAPIAPTLAPTPAPFKLSPGGVVGVAVAVGATLAVLVLLWRRITRWFKGKVLDEQEAAAKERERRLRRAEKDKKAADSRMTKALGRLQSQARVLTQSSWPPRARVAPSDMAGYIANDRSRGRDRGYDASLGRVAPLDFLLPPNPASALQSSSLPMPIPASVAAAGGMLKQAASKAALGLPNADFYALETCAQHVGLGSDRKTGKGAGGGTVDSDDDNSDYSHSHTLSRDSSREGGDWSRRLFSVPHKDSWQLQGKAEEKKEDGSESETSAEARNRSFSQSDDDIDGGSGGERPMSRDQVRLILSSSDPSLSAGTDLMVQGQGQRRPPIRLQIDEFALSSDSDNDNGNDNNESDDDLSRDSLFGYGYEEETRPAAKY